MGTCSCELGSRKGPPTQPFQSAAFSTPPPNPQEAPAGVTLRRLQSRPIWGLCSQPVGGSDHSSSSAYTGHVMVVVNKTQSIIHGVLAHVLLGSLLFGLDPSVDPCCLELAGPWIPAKSQPPCAVSWYPVGPAQAPAWSTRTRRGVLVTKSDATSTLDLSSAGVRRAL